MGVIVILFSAPTAKAITMPPISLSGNIRYQYSHLITESGARSVSQGEVGQISAGSYIWRPWFANWNSNLRVGHITAKNESTNTTNDYYSGQLGLALFHKSHFPFQADYSITDSRIDVDEASISAGGRKERFSLSQQYYPRGANGQYSARYIRSLDTNFEFDNDSISNDLVLRANNRFNTNAFDSTISYQDSEQEVDGDQNERDKLYGVSFSHSYSGNSRFSLDDQINMNVEQDDIGKDNEVETREANASSNAKWRSDVLPLSISGGVNLYSLEIERQAVISRSTSASGYGRADYTVTDQLRTYVSARHSNTTSNGTDGYNANQKIGATYRGLQRVFYGYSFSWGSSLSATNTDDDDGSQSGQDVSGTANYSLSRHWPMPEYQFTTFSFSLNQGLFGVKSNYRDSSATLTTSIDTSLLRDAGAIRTEFQFNLYGSEFYSDDDEVEQSSLQTAQIYFTHRYKKSFSPHSGMSAGFNTLINYTVFNDRHGDPSGSTSAVATYYNNYLYRARGLRFRSDLEYKADDYLSADVTDTETYTLRWKNDFRYQVGLLDVNLDTVLNQSQGGGIAKALHLSVTRYF